MSRRADALLGDAEPRHGELATDAVVLGVYRLAHRRWRPATHGTVPRSDETDRTDAEYLSTATSMLA
jgi:hypothetical protein